MLDHCHRAALLSVALLPNDCLAVAQANEQHPPHWAMEYTNFFTQADGCWEADNTQFFSKAEPFTRYRIIWTAGLSPASKFGKLYGYDKLGKQEEFWRYLVYWNGLTQTLDVTQVGRAGVVGTGSISRVEAGHFVEEQVFSFADGQSWLSQHDIWLHAAEFQTTSLRLSNERWESDRTYTWKPCG